MGQTGILLLLILFMGGMLFMSSRQRKKQQQQADELQRSINVGDVVRMTSGISGTVVDTSDEETLDIEIAQNIITTWLRAAVREKLSPDAGHDDARADEHQAIDGATGSAPTDSTSGATTGTTSGATTGTTSDATADATGSSRNGSEPSGEVSSPRSS